MVQLDIDLTELDPGGHGEAACRAQRRVLEFGYDGSSDPGMFGAGILRFHTPLAPFNPIPNTFKH